MDGARPDEGHWQHHGPVLRARHLRWRLHRLVGPLRQAPLHLQRVDQVTVNEFIEGPDPNPTAANVTTRTTVEVRDALNALRDQETGIAFTLITTSATTRRFESAEIALSDSTARQFNNGVLDVRDGDRLVVNYADVGNTRSNTSTVDCSVQLSLGDIEFAQVGRDASFLITGGCERNARGLFEFDAPDRYIDESESVIYGFAFGSAESEDLQNVVVSLRCVDTDADSPESCLPTSVGDCADPKRENNTSCNGGAGADWVSVVDSPRNRRSQGRPLAATSPWSRPRPSPAPQLRPARASGPAAPASAKSSSCSRWSLRPPARLPRAWPSTVSASMPTSRRSSTRRTSRSAASTSTVDRNNNEVVENPTTNIGDFIQDYRFETRTFGDMTAGRPEPRHPVAAVRLSAPGLNPSSIGGRPDRSTCGATESLSVTGTLRKSVPSSRRRRQYTASPVGDQRGD